jgi:hypothetical protein
MHFKTIAIIVTYKDILRRGVMIGGRVWVNVPTEPRRPHASAASRPSVARGAGLAGDWNRVVRAESQFQPK